MSRSTRFVSLKVCVGFFIVGFVKSLQKIVFLVAALQNWGYDNFSHRNARFAKLWTYVHMDNMIWVV